jgi:hypothetical protein
VRRANLAEIERSVHYAPPPDPAPGGFAGLARELVAVRAVTAEAAASTSGWRCGNTSRWVVESFSPTFPPWGTPPSTRHRAGSFSDIPRSSRSPPGCWSHHSSFGWQAGQIRIHPCHAAEVGGAQSRGLARSQLCRVARDQRSAQRRGTPGKPGVPYTPAEGSQSSGRADVHELRHHVQGGGAGDERPVTAT